LGASRHPARAAKTAPVSYLFAPSSPQTPRPLHGNRGNSLHSFGCFPSSGQTAVNYPDLIKILEETWRLYRHSHLFTCAQPTLSKTWMPKNKRSSMLLNLMRSHHPRPVCAASNVCEELDVFPGLHRGGGGGQGGRNTTQTMQNQTNESQRNETQRTTDLQ
jgi:hypothetical protein